VLRLQESIPCVAVVGGVAGGCVLTGAAVVGFAMVVVITSTGGSVVVRCVA